MSKVIIIDSKNGALNIDKSRQAPNVSNLNEDLVLIFELQKLNIDIHHINNPLYHLNLEKSIFANSSSCSFEKKLNCVSSFNESTTY